MPYDAFPECYSYVAVHEGGRVDHPSDPGGRTNLGVTQRVYDAWRKRRGLRPQDVWKIGADEAKEIFREGYWTPAGCDQMWPGLNYAVFDYAVNSGVSRAVKELQRLLRVPEDGIFGPITRAAAAGVDDKPGLIAKYCVARVKFLMSLRTWPTFGKGWMRRVMGKSEGTQPGDTGVIDRATRMARGLAARAPDHREEGAGKALETDHRTTPTERVTKAGPVIDGAGGVAAGTAAGVIASPELAERYAAMLGISPAVVFGAAVGVALAAFLGPRLLRWLDSRRATV